MQTMKKNLTLILLAITFSAYSQSWLTEMRKSDRNFYSIKKKADKYFKSEIKQLKYEARHTGKNKQEAEEDEGVEGFKIYKRWEEFWKPRINADGSFPAPDAVYNEMVLWNKKHANQVQSVGNWTPIGPFTVAAGSGWSPGIGRVNGMTVNPQNPNEIFACAPAGGIWKSVTGGNNFTTTTDQLTAIGFTSIAVDPNNPNIVYAASGDGEAGDTYSLGVLKSTDAGATWNTTGLSWSTSKSQVTHKIEIDPTNSNILFVATNAGLFKSVDAAVSWYQVINANIFDFEFKPGNSNILYAVSSTLYYKSTDNGQTFVQLSAGLPGASAVSRLAIAVTPANADLIYIIAGANSDNGFLGLYVSIDSGDSFNFVTNQPNVMGWDMNGSDNGGQSWYTLTIAADPNDAQHILTGGVNLWESFDGGQSFIINAHWVINPTNYVHADIHFLDFVGGILFAGTDGGLYKSTNAGGSWTDISAGLQVSQFYRMGASTSDPNLIFGGAQDNGGIRIMNGIADQWIGADGFEHVVHPTNNNIVYGVIQYGGMYKSTDMGNSFSGISIPGQGDWNSPFILNNSGDLYVGYQTILKSTNNGNSFTQLTGNMGTLKQMAICKSNQNVIYATNGSDVYKVDATTGNITNITNGLPGVKSYVAVADNNSDKVYVTVSGFSKGNKVFRSDDGGLTWLNISGNLPNIPINTISCDTFLLEGLYIGSESGVFYRNNNSNDWQLFSNGLPRTIVNELEFNYGTNKLRAATYGRGIWESDLYLQTVPVADFTQNRDFICPGLTVTFTDISTEGPTARLWSFPGGIPATATTKTVTVVYPANGNYDVSLTATNTAGTNTVTKNQLITVSTNLQPVPFSEGFENSNLPLGWRVINVGDDAFTWSQTTPGAYNNSTNSYKCTNFNANAFGTIDHLVLAQYDLSSISNPEFRFDVAYGKRTPSSRDSLKLEATLDCGDTWITIYNKGGNTLKTTSNYFINAAFVPSATEWRTETVDLTGLSTQTQVGFRFTNFSGQGNDIYIDNINLATTTGIDNVGSLENQSLVFPNPVVDISTLHFNYLVNTSQLKLCVYNVLGEQIKTVSLKNNTSEVLLKKADFNNGFYFFKLLVNDILISKGKFIVE